MEVFIITATAVTITRKGYYYISVQYKDEVTGKWKSTTKGTGLKVAGNNKRAAEKKRLEVLDEYLSKQSVDSNMKLSDFFKVWLVQTESTVEKNTFRGYKGNMEKHIIPYFEGKKITLGSVKAVDLEEYYSLKEKSGLSAQTVKHHHENISAALGYAVRKGLIQANPAQGMRNKPKPKAIEMEYLTAEQAKTLLRLFENENIYIPVLLCVFYGLRRSEVLGLTWDSVDLDGRQITIRAAQIQNTGENYFRASTKNKSSYRTLPISSDEILECLRQHKKHQEEQKLLLGEKYVDNGHNYVCTFDNGKAISPNYLSKNFHAVQVKNGFQPLIRLHDLRHTFASIMLSRTDIKALASWLGHSSPTTTLSIYAHIHADESKQRMGTEMAQILFS